MKAFKILDKNGKALTMGELDKEATEFLRNYIIDSMLGDQVRQTAPTYADKANAKLAETKADYNQRLRKQREEFNEKTTSIKEQNKQRVKEAISKERQRGEHRLQKFRDSVKERDTKRKETAEKSRYKKQIEKNVKTANEQVLHSLHYAYVSRRKVKSDYRKLWIVRINAAARNYDMSYSTLMHGLKVAGINVNRKMLSEMAITDEKGFEQLVNLAKKALAK